MSALTAAGAALVACGGAEPESPEEPGMEEEPADAPPEAEAVELDYVANWGDKYTITVWDALREVPEFQDFLGNNEIQITSIGGDALTTRVAAGEPPDGASNVDYVQYMSRGNLLDIESWVNGSEYIDPDDHIESVWGNASYKGVMYGVPANENWIWYGLNYNKVLIEEAGLDPDNPPVTWNEALAWHQELTQFDDAGNMMQLGLDPYDAIANEPDFWGLSYGFQWFNENTGEFNLDNEMMVEAIETGAEFYEIAGPDNMVAMRQVEGQGTWGGSYNAEVQSMIIEGYWHPGETMTSKPEVGENNMTSWAPVPESRKGTKIQGAGGHYVVFFNESQHPEEMFKIAEFLNTDGACQAIWDTTGWLPSRQSFIETVDPDKYPGLSFYLVDVEETTDWLRGGRRCPIHWFVTSAFGELREAVYRGNMTAEEAAAELQQRALDEWSAQDLG